MYINAYAACIDKSGDCGDMVPITQEHSRLVTYSETTPKSSQTL